MSLEIFSLMIWVIILIGIVGILVNKQSLILFLICLEISYNGFLFFILHTATLYDSYEALSYYLFILAFIASEAVIGLLLVVKIKKLNKNVEFGVLSILRDL